MIGLKRNQRKLAKWLVRDGHLSRRQARLAVKSAAENGRAFCQELVHHNLIGEEELFTYLAERLGLPTVGRGSLGVDMQTLESVPVELRYRRDLLPLKQVGKSLSIAMADPTDRATLDALADETGLHIRPVLAALPALNNAHERLAGLDNLRKISEDGDLFKRYVSFFEALTEYRFEKVVGQGGFGVVCLCWQASQERHVAIKVLNPEWNAVTQVAERFRREGGIISQLAHPNIIEVYEQGELDGIGYIVMEYFEGRRLDEHLAERDWGRVLSALLQVCHALDYAHHKGVIHRDIKPANVLGNELGAVKLLDFGVAHHDAQPSDLTTPQLILGTPKYMAPELNHGADKTSNASDLYAFGVMAYEVLTKKPCEQGRICHPTVVDERIPQWLGTAILRCLHPKPAQRPKSFTEVAELFQRAIDVMIFGETTEGRPPSEARKGRVESIDQLFEIQAVLRKSEAGHTLRALHKKLDRLMVIKIVKQPGGIRRLQDIANLKSVEIGEILGIGKQDDTVLVVSEFLGGGSVESLLETELSPIEVIDILEAVAQALCHAESAGLAHGNLHPGNVLLTKAGVVKVVDFGMPCSREDFAAHYRPKGIADAYQADLHALGVMAYEIMSGTLYESRRPRCDQFEELAAEQHVHPLLKYFLSRMWRIKEQDPPYEGYRDMLADLGRIRRRMEEGPEWDAEPGEAPEPTTADQTQGSWAFFSRMFRRGAQA